MTYYKKFDSGLRMVVKKIDGLLSVSMGALVGTGSCFETQSENGISHFIEHMMFKGTNKRTAFEISDAMDRIGALLCALEHHVFYEVGYAVLLIRLVGRARAHYYAHGDGEKSRHLLYNKSYAVVELFEMNHYSPKL